MAAALFAFSTMFVLAACVRADRYGYQERDLSLKETKGSSDSRDLDQASLLSGCLYEGRWHASGSTVVTRESCLRCVCVRSALSCRRRACAPIDDPPPKRCHIKHRRDACCPELVCPDGIVKREHGAVKRFELEDLDYISTPTSTGLACVEGGTVYAAGSAMSSNVACEQCFCLKGARKCVRPTCLPPPPHCVPRPTAGACCPQKYYCEHDSEAAQEHKMDCKVDGKRIQEGERVPSETECTACFCLKGVVQCQAMACAPSLHGCQPVMRPGDCCAHQYKCEHQKPTPYRGLMSHQRPAFYNSLSLSRNDDRALHVQRWHKASETSTKKVLPDIYTSKNTPVAATTNDLSYTVKVKRKTIEPNENQNNDSEPNLNTSQKSTDAIDDIENYDTAFNDTADEEMADTTELTLEKASEQPEGTVKVIINETINCTAELSSTSLPISIIANNTKKAQPNILPRIPIVNSIEAQTYSPNDIITDRSVDGNFDENDTFTINVTSSLNGNTNVTLNKQPMLTDITKTLNNSKTTEDYDYDYAEPTLPPSLPNLKIIPFVAADAVVDDDLGKETHDYPILERDDKFPVYYPPDTKDSTFNRREDIYRPTQYPVYAPEKDYDLNLSSDRYPMRNVKYTVSTALRNHKTEEKAVTKAPITSPTYGIETPTINLFSPPIETEGGFIPKGPGIIDEYYAGFHSTPSGVAIPHLTTSMRLDIHKGECTTEDGKIISEGESLTVDCNECLCTWGQLRCAPTLCRAPPGCQFKEPDPDSVNQCCGDIICKKDNKTATVAPVTGIPETESMINIQHKFPQSSTILHTTKIQTQEMTTLKSIEIVAPHTTLTNDTIINTLNYTGSSKNTTIETLTSTSKYVISVTTTASPINSFEANDTSSEYDDEEDVGFSFGSVLKLLLSDSYDTTTKAPNKKVEPTKPPIRLTPPSVSSTRRPPSTVNPFIPLPSLPLIPPNIVTSTVNRIDHLVLGEATAIKRTTTKRPNERSTDRPTEMSTERHIDIATPSLRPSFSGSTGSNSPGVGAGLLKLAGCNIYGRIYRVGRIIAELSTPCLECWCVEIGVECKKLDC